MFEYKFVKVNYEEREDEISRKLTEYGKKGWELVSFQASSESRGLLKSVIALTSCYVLIFRRKAKEEEKNN